MKTFQPGTEILDLDGVQYELVKVEKDGVKTVELHKIEAKKKK